MRDYIDGDLRAIPAGSTNGTPLVGAHARPVTVAIELGATDSVTYTIAAKQPEAAPTIEVTRDGGDMQRVEEKLGRLTDIYVTAISGAPMFRVF